MSELHDFRPDWASPPGHTIADILEEREISFKEFARRMDMPLLRARELMCGSASVDVAIARKLECLLGPSTDFWLRRESQYQFDTKRLEARFTGPQATEWLRELPLADMVRFGWIDRARTAEAKLRACLNFFGVSDIDTWRERYSGALAVASFRNSTAFDANSAAVAAWLRRAELSSDRISCKPWDAGEFRETLPQIKRLTRRKDPTAFLPELRRLCSNCGVAIVIVRAPVGCRASGATQFLSTDKAMIALSFRYLSDDQFWFTFFHEAGHLLLHGRDALFLEDGSDVTSREEGEANEFAVKTLIPEELVSTLENLRADMRDVIRFAQAAGVSPGIVVGQLQYHGRVAPNRLNSLKRRFSWSKIPQSDITP